MTDIPARETILIGLRAAIAETLDGVDRDRLDINAVHAGTPMLSLPIDSLALMQIVTTVEDRRCRCAGGANRGGGRSSRSARRHGRRLDL